MLVCYAHPKPRLSWLQILSVCSVSLRRDPYLHAAAAHTCVQCHVSYRAAAAFRQMRPAEQHSQLKQLRQAARQLRPGGSRPQLPPQLPGPSNHAMLLDSTAPAQHQLDAEATTSASEACLGPFGDVNPQVGPHIRILVNDCHTCAAKVPFKILMLDERTDSLTLCGHLRMDPRLALPTPNLC